MLSGAEAPESLSSLAQRIRPVDDGHQLRGFDALIQVREISVRSQADEAFQVGVGGAIDLVDFVGTEACTGARTKRLGLYGQSARSPLPDPNAAAA
jgi:hypothetical protein